MLPIWTPENPRVLLMYAPKEMSHAPHTKNCRKFMTVSRNEMLISPTLPEIRETRTVYLLAGSLSAGDSNRLTMFWYFSMYPRFSLLYLGMETGTELSPSVFHTQGHFTAGPENSGSGRANSSSPSFMRLSTL